MIKRILVILLALANLFSSTAFSFEISDNSEVLRYYVSPDGNDENDGSFENPFKTVNHAKEVVRESLWRKSKPIEIILRGGRYECFDALEFTKKDSGSEKAPITYKGYENENVVFDAGYTVKNEVFSPVKDKKILERLSEDVWDKIVEAPLGDIIKGEIPGPIRVDHGWKNPESMMQIFSEKKRLTLARWPNNKEFTNMGRVISMGVKNGVGAKSTGQGFTFEYVDTRIEKYKDLDNVWMYGRWRLDWAPAAVPIGSIDTVKKTITTRDSCYSGPAAYKPYYYYNVLEELDYPGEYYIDNKTKTLYYYPIDENKNDIYITYSKKPIIDMLKAKYITFENITFQSTRVNTMVLNMCENIKVKNCVIRFSGFYAISISEDCFNIYIDNNEIYECDAGGIQSYAGNLKLLKPSETYITNNHIYNFAMYDTTYHPAVVNFGVYEVVANNVIHGTEHMAIQNGGTGTIYEYNEFYDTVIHGDDSGCFYVANTPQSVDQHIRYNYIHNSGWVGTEANTDPWSIYLDGFKSSVNIYGNLFRETGGVFMNKGGRCNIYDNTFISVSIPIRCGTGSSEIWSHWNTLFKSNVSYDRGLWKYRYPELYEDWTEMGYEFVGRKSNVYRNLSYNCLRYWIAFSKNEKYENKEWDNFVVEENIFRDLDNNDYTIIGENPIEDYYNLDINKVGIGKRTLEEIIETTRKERKERFN